MYFFKSKMSSNIKIAKIGNEKNGRKIREILNIATAKNLIKAQCI